MRVSTSHFDRQSSEPIFLTSSSKPFTPFDSTMQKYSSVSARRTIGTEPKAVETRATTSGFKVQRSHKRVKPVFEDGVRVRIYEVEPSDRVHLFHGLPFQKYNQSLVRMFEFQRMIVINELKLLLDKAKSLKAKLNEVIPTQALDLALFDLVDEKIQQSFNAIFEETIGLVYKVSEILMECNRYSVCEAKMRDPLPFRKPVGTETEVFFSNIKLFVKEVDRLTTAQEYYIRATKRKRVKSHINTMEPTVMNLLMQYLARARFNVGEVHEEFTFQEAHQSQQTKWLCKMATMSSLQDFVPEEVKQLMRAETTGVMPTEKQQTLTREEVKDRVKTGYKKGSLARNMGLAVLHAQKENQAKRATIKPELQTNSDFIQKLLSKFSTSPKLTKKTDMATLPPTELVSIERYRSQASELEDIEDFKNFTGMMALTRTMKQAQKVTERKTERRIVAKSDKGVIKALHIGLLVSSDEKRFSAIRSIILEHEQILRNRDERLRIEKELLS